MSKKASLFDDSDEEEEEYKPQVSKPEVEQKNEI